MSEQSSAWNYFYCIKNVINRDASVAGALTPEFTEAIIKLLEPQDDGSHRWAKIQRRDVTYEFDSFEDFVTNPEGLETTPKRLLKLLDVDAVDVDGASEAAEMVRELLKHQGRRWLS